MSVTEAPLQIKAFGHAEDDVIHQLYHSLKEFDSSGISITSFIDVLKRNGIEKEDKRVKGLLQILRGADDQQKIPFSLFREAVQKNICLIEKVMTGKLIIPDFEGFSQDIKEIYREIEKKRGGKLASYIPQLARVDPEQLAVTICTVDGQKISLGDHETPFVMESVCKSITYCLALEALGEEKVHQHIGREPSGHSFNELRLNNQGLPHNPMINAGAIMSCALFNPEKNTADRFDYVLEMVEKLSGRERPGFNNSVYLSEKQTADRNFALGYFMREKGAFPDNTNLIETLEFYFQCCSIEVTTDSMAVIAASLANGGICPVTGERSLKAETVKDCLSLLYSCGMYDFSGEFAFTIGLPAKSGVSGAILLVVPNVMGVAIWSPRLDPIGNSVRGIEFCKRLIDRFNFHNYDSLIQSGEKKDPRLHKNQLNLETIGALIWAASQGDINEVRRLIATGIDLDRGDYDGRTAIHLAASEGQEEMVKYLIDRGVEINPIDRWGNTPLNDARRAEHEKVAILLKEKGGELGKVLKVKC